MEDKNSRRSQWVGWVWVGLAGAYVALPLIPEGKTYRQNVYSDWSDCEADYSRQQCQQDNSSSSPGGRVYFVGPSYAADRNNAAANDPGPGRSGVTRTFKTSVRGGFGAIGRFARAVG
jgi:hypothetical protein